VGLQGYRSKPSPAAEPVVSGRLARRAVWGLADQVLSSLTNFAVGVVVARSLGAEVFGAFTLAFSTYLVALNVSRALATEPLAIRYSVAPVANWRRAVGSATGTAAMVGAAGGVGCLLVAWLLAGPTRGAFLALGLTLPGLLLQDGWRFVFFSRRRGLSAFLNDLFWGLALVPALGVLLVTGHASVSLLVLAWGGAANVAALVGVLQARVTPRPLAAGAWLGKHRDLAPRYLAEFVALSGAIQLYLWGIGAITGLAAVGALRAAQMLVSPLSIVLMGITMMGVPEAIRILDRSAKGFVTLGAVLSATLGMAVLLWGAVLLFAPARLGLWLLGPSWEPARQVLLPIVLWLVGGAVILGPEIGLRALAAARRSLRARMAGSALSVVGALLGSMTGGALGAAWGLALASLAGAPLWWWHLARGLVEGRRPGQRVMSDRGPPSGGLADHSA
jgi:O-antigen/teichoic acid export membrane protein